ncbi:hypothetical protein VTO42DRAFT_8337 [Malbranchea cinnamomea]
MPSLVPQPRQDLGRRPLVLSRPAEDDEHYAMWRYASHATRCSRCEHPLETWRQGDALCRRGILHARTVTQYLYSENGKLYSTVDRDMGRCIQVQLPPSCTVVRELMLAMERGLAVDSPKSASTDLILRSTKTQVQNYHEKQPQYNDDWDPMPVLPCRTKKRPSDECHYSPRGTLYDADMSQAQSKNHHLRKPQRRLTWKV